MANIEVLRVPTIEYSGMYFPEIASRLRQMERTYVPEITNEDKRSIVIQLERSFALMVHYNNVLLDMVANEMFLDTSKLPESIKLNLGLINYRLLASSPGQVDMLGKLSRTYTTTTRLLDANRKFATKRSSNENEIVFENAQAVDTENRTDQLSDAYTAEYVSDCICYTDSSDSDKLFWTSGDNWVTSDLGNYVEIFDSILGNNREDKRIIELLDETTPGSGIYRTIRLENASFISETDITGVIRSISANHAATLNAGTGAGIFTVPPMIDDKFYFGHSDVMWDRFDTTLSFGTPSINAVFEFYDNGETTFQPDDVTVDPSPGQLRFELTSFLGIENRTNSLITVTYVPTGTQIIARSTFVGGLNVVDIPGYLGQTTPSTTPGDYFVQSDWRPIDVLVDTTKPGSVPWQVSGYTTYNLPQNQDDNWQEFSLYIKSLGETRTAYFLRYRVISNPGSTAPPIPSRIVITTGEQYALIPLVQGKTVEDSPLGSSSGDASQEFTLRQTPYVYQSVRVFVDEGGGDIEWREVTTFLTSYTTSRHFVVDVQTNGSAIIKFGDGINGRIPPAGVNNIRAIYRIGADEDGNIGANTLVVNRDGAGVFKSVTNPRSGRYWVEADWNSQDSLERAKLLGPQSLLTMFRSMTPRDAEILARSFKDANGVKAVQRSKAYEESFGPKTLEIVVSGTGGASLTASYKEELQQFFNSGGGYGGILIMNHEVTVTNYTPRMIGYTLEITANPTVTEALVLQTLSALISPSALEDDQTTYVWEFGQEVPNARVISEIFKISSGNVFNVKISSPSADVSLGQRELPLLDVVNTHIVIVPPNF